MRWWPTACRPGDMIRVRIGSLWHYGVYVSDAEVIQFGPPPRGKPVPADEIRVCTTSVDAFAGDDIIEVAQLSPWEKLRRVPPKETVRLARSRVGEGGYHVLDNNCEHFATSCVLGRARSAQSEAAASEAQSGKRGRG